MTKTGSKAGDPAEVAGQELPGQVAELVGELSATDPAGQVRRTGSAGRIRRLTAATARAAGRGGHVTWRGAHSAGRWLADQVIAMAPRLPVRDQATLRRQFPDCSPEELADVLIRGSSRTAASVGAAVGAATMLPVVPAMPVEIATETLALVGIELKLIAELHEVYGMRAPGSVAERMTAYVGAWASRAGVALAPGGIILVVGSPLRRRLQRRLLARAGRSATSLGPLLTGALAGAALNRRETRRLGQEIRNDLRHRSPAAAQWAAAPTPPAPPASPASPSHPELP